MSWFRCDDQLADHPKVVALGPLRAPGIGLWVMCGTYCSKHLTDGYVSEHVVTMYAGKDAKRLSDALVRVGLFIPVDGGYQLHDYLDWNPTREEVMEKRARAAELGRAGGLAKARQNAKRDAKPDAKPEGTQPAYARPDPYPSPSNEGETRAMNPVEKQARLLLNGGGSEKQIDTVLGLAEQVGETAALRVLEHWRTSAVRDRFGQAMAELVEAANKKKRGRLKAVPPKTNYDRLEVSDDENAGAA